MIFKTFDSDIDKISAEWGVFGKSFYDFAEASRNRKIVIDDLFTLGGVPLKDAKKQAGSFWSYLYPKKEDIQAQLIDVDSVLPKIDENEASNVLNIIKSIEDGTYAEAKSFQELYDTGDKTNQWIAKYAQETKGQIRSTEGVINANQAARDAAIAHNAALKQQTLGAKATTVAMKALSVAANMGLLFVVQGVISGLTDLFTSTERLQERAEGFTSSLDEMNEKFAKGKKTISELNEQYERLSKGVDDAGKNVSLTSEEYEEYKNVVSQISDLMPDLNVLYDENGNKIKVMADNMKSLNEQYAEYERNTAKELLYKGNDKGETFKDVLDNYNEQVRGRNSYNGWGAVGGQA